MIIKALAIKKAVVIASMVLTGVADGVLTNRTHRMGGREVNPSIRPFVGSSAVYPALQVDVIISSLLVIKRPDSRVTKFMVAGTLGAHTAGIVSNLSIHQSQFVTVCSRSAPDGSGEVCRYEVRK
jgi:hypothetical protein